MSTTPATNTGIDISADDAAVTTRSSAPPTLAPVSTPSGTATSREIPTASSAISSVTGSRSTTISSTGLPDWMDRPRSPVNRPVTHSPYRTGNGRSNPYSASIAASCSGVADGPRIAADGEPGIRSTSAAAASVTSSSTARRWTARRAARPSRARGATRTPAAMASAPGQAEPVVEQAAVAVQGEPAQALTVHGVRDLLPDGQDRQVLHDQPLHLGVRLTPGGLVRAAASLLQGGVDL